MRWVLLAAVALVVALMLLFWQGDEPKHREAERPVAPTKEDHWRQQEQRRDQADPSGPESVSTKTTLTRKPVWTNTAYASTIVVEVLYGDGTPAEGARVGHVFSPVMAAGAKTEATTDSSGIAKLSIGAHVRWAFARRGALVAAPVRVQGSQRIRLVLQADGFVIRGVLLDPDGGPVRSIATVSVNYWDGFEWRFQQGFARNGKFECLPVARGAIERMHIYVSDVPGLPRNLFEWTVPVTDLTLRLTSETVRGRVVHPDSRPAPHVQVNTGETALRTDKDGRFEAAFQKREGSLLRINNMVRVLKASDRDIEIVLRPGKPLHGRLLTHDRKPLALASVSLSLPVGGVLARAGTDTGGRFQFLALAEGPHNLRFRFFGSTEIRDATEYVVGDVRATDKLLEIVLPEPIRAKVRLRSEDGHTPIAAKHGALIVRKGDREILKWTWSPSVAKQEVTFRVWDAGVYNMLVTAALYEPAQLRSVRITESGENAFDLALKKRKHVR